MVTIAIVEDNIYCLNMIGQQLRESMEEEYVLNTYTNTEDYLNVLLNERIEFDVVILDIELDNKSGIDLAIQTNITSPLTQIIFVTAYINYASDVYESKHVYFMCKERIDQYLPIALERALTNVHNFESQMIYLSWNKQTFKVSQRDIIYAERDYRITYVYTKNEVYRTSKKINELINDLNSCFCMCHKSIVVNLNYVKDIQRNTVILKTDKTLPISRSQKDDFKKNFNHFLINKNVED